MGKRAKRQWTAIVAVLVVALVTPSVYRLHGIFGSDVEIEQSVGPAPQKEVSA
jgi:hypothetical protein